MASRNDLNAILMIPEVIAIFVASTVSAYTSIRSQNNRCIFKLFDVTLGWYDPFHSSNMTSAKMAKNRDGII